MERQILHVEVSAFAVAVERVVDRRLEGRPVVVAPPGGPRSVVTAASLEACREGIRPGMSVGRATRRCRGLVVLPPNPVLYARATRALAAIYEQYSPMVEPGGCGRAHLDLTGTGRLFGPARDTAWRIQERIIHGLHLSATVGVGTNKLVSRVASEQLPCPPHVHDVAAGGEARFLAPLPVGVLPGVGKRVLERLSDFNVRSVGELARIPLRHLELGFGPLGLSLHLKARGIDSSPVCPPPKNPVLKEEEQLASDTNDYPALLDVLRRLVERSGRRLRGAGRVAGRLSIEVRHADHREVRGTVRLAPATAWDALILETARPVLDRLLERRIRVRRLALTFHQLAGAPGQLSLLRSNEPTRDSSLLSALDAIHAKYGEGAVVRGMAVERKDSAAA